MGQIEETIAPVYPPLDDGSVLKEKTKKTQIICANVYFLGRLRRLSANNLR